MSRSVSEILKQLKEDNPGALIDSVNKEPPKVDLSKVNSMSAPSEIKKMAEAIKRKRLTASGLSDLELKNLMRRIGQ